MTREDDIQNAHDAGRFEGREETIKELRTFTGVAGFKPSLDAPEHTAYVDYERELINAAAVGQQNLDRAREELQSKIDRRNKTFEDLQTALDRRREERAGSPIGRLIGKATDRTIPQRAVHDRAERDAKGAQKRVSKAVSHLQAISDELVSVRRWLETMFSEVEQASASRDALIEQARLDEERATRDITPRWCSVYSLQAFVDEDPQRRSAAWGDNVVVSGIDYGYRWRRDGDDSALGDGNWSLHWIEETHETILERRSPHAPIEIWLLGAAITSNDDVGRIFIPLEARMSERNSLALVLDAYAAAAGSRQ